MFFAILFVGSSVAQTASDLYADADKVEKIAADWRNQDRQLWQTCVFEQHDIECYKTKMAAVDATMRAKIEPVLAQVRPRTHTAIQALPTKKRTAVDSKVTIDKTPLTQVEAFRLVRYLRDLAQRKSAP